MKVKLNNTKEFKLDLSSPITALKVVVDEWLPKAIYDYDAEYRCIGYKSKSLTDLTTNIRHYALNESCDLISEDHWELTPEVNDLKVKKITGIQECYAYECSNVVYFMKYDEHGELHPVFDSKESFNEYVNDYLKPHESFENSVNDSIQRIKDFIKNEKVILSEKGIHFNFDQGRLFEWTSGQFVISRSYVY